MNREDADKLAIKLVSIAIQNGNNVMLHMKEGKDQAQEIADSIIEISSKFQYNIGDFDVDELIKNL